MENYINDIIANSHTVLIIDNLSSIYRDKNEIAKISNNVNILDKDKDNKKIYLISNFISHDFENLFLNPDKINEIEFFFSNNNIYFDIIIDNNSKDYITQIASFSLLFKKTIKKYIIKLDNKNKGIIIYNVQKFTTNIFNEHDYLIITK